MSRILVGVVGAPHGIKGEVRVKSFTDRPVAIADYGPLLVETRAPLVVTACRPVKDDMLVVRFAGVASRDAAVALTGTRLFIDRTALPVADEEEFYHADLIGLRVETPDGVAVGRILRVANYGGGDLLDIAGEGTKSWLVAFTRAFVPVVDVAGGRVVVLAEALVDDTADAPDEADPAP